MLSFGSLSTVVFFFTSLATSVLYTLSLHDALPIFPPMAAAATASVRRACASGYRRCRCSRRIRPSGAARRSEEHTSELQSRPHLVCRLLLEKKKDGRSLDGIPQNGVIRPGLLQHIV